MQRLVMAGRWLSGFLTISISLICFPILAGVIHGLLRKTIRISDIANDPKDVLLQWQYAKTYFELDPVNVFFWLATLYAIYAAIRFIIAGRVEKKDTFEQRSDYGSHGSARWQSVKEKRESYYQTDQGFIIGDTSERIYVPGRNYAVIPNNETKSNLNIIAFGPPGSEKTTGLILPNIVHTALNKNSSMVITDPKGELYANTSSLLKERGYEVFVLDFLHVKRGNRINFNDYVYEDTDLMKIADSFVQGANIAKGSKGSQDPIWDQGETSLLASLIGFVRHVYRDEPEKQTFSQISKLVNTKFLDPDQYQFLFRVNGVTGTAEHLFNNFLLAKDKVRDGILFGLATKLTLFGIPAVEKLTQVSDFNIEDLARRKIALYLLVSDADRTFSPLVTVLWSVLFNAIYKVRLTEPESVVPIECYMDELANIGRIAGLQEKLGTMRSRFIHPIMIWQSLPQLKDRYPNDAWLDVISMCDTRLLLAANDDTTKEYFSKELGKTTVEVQGTSENYRRDDILHSGAGASSNYTGRPLMFPDEIGKMPKDEIIVMEKGKDPAVLKKLQYRYWEKQYQVCETTTYNAIPPLITERLDDIPETEDPGLEIEDAQEVIEQSIEQTEEQFIEPIEIKKIPTIDLSGIGERKK